MHTLSRIAPPLAALAALAACQSSAPTAPTTADYRLIDLTSTYTRLYDATEDQPDDQRATTLQAGLAAQFPQFYRPRPPTTEAGFTKRIRTSLKGFPTLRPNYERVAHDFAATIDTAIATFRQALPDLAPLGDVYLLHSLDEMDGGTRTIDGVRYFIFGADVIARIHSPGSEQPFFHHELFHIYHQQTFAGCEEMWCSLWLEGLADRAAFELNPGTTDAQMMLNLPLPIRAPVDANFTEAVCAVQARLESTSTDDYGVLFSFRRLNPRLPPRFGYYIGLRVADEARRTYGLAELARLTVDQARPVVAGTIAALATCPG